EEAVRRRVALPEAEEELGGRGGTRLDEGLARHDLEEIAALERLAGAVHDGGVLARRVVAAARDVRGGHVRRRGAIARQAHGGAPVHLELVAAALGGLAPVID